MAARNFTLLLCVVLVLFAGSVATAEVVAEMACPAGGCTLTVPDGEFVLWSQLDDPSSYAFTDQQFEPQYVVHNSEGADDFEVDHPLGWNIALIHTPGLQAHPNPPFDLPLFVNNFFYADAGGLPGPVLDGCAFPANSNFAYESVGEIAVVLSSFLDCNAPSGTHWFSQQVRLDGVTGGSYFWPTRSNATGNPAVWRNPGNEFGTNCLDWSPANAICGMDGEDYLFALSGTVREPPATPAVGPIGATLMVIALGGASAYVLRHRRS